LDALKDYAEGAEKGRAVRLQAAMDNGAKRALIPIENKRSFFDVSADVLESVGPVCYGDLRAAAFKALGLG